MTSVHCQTKHQKLINLRFSSQDRNPYLKVSPRWT